MIQIFGESANGEPDDRDASPFEPDSRGGRWLRRHHAGGVCVVTTITDGTYLGSTLSAWMVVSIEPLQVLISVEVESQMALWLPEAGFFALNVLPWSEQFHADQFAGFTPRASPAFSGIEHQLGDRGMPILSRSVAWAECEVERTFDLGDHTCVVGAVLDLGPGNGDESDPLIYYLNGYRRFRP